MSWKYSSYIPSHSASRESSQIRLGFPNAKLGSSPSDRWSSVINADSRLSRNFGDALESSSVWARTRSGDGPASVQRIRERYNSSEEPKKEIRAYKKAETKELNSARPGRTYGRSQTSLTLPDSGGDGSRFRRASENSPETEKAKGGTSLLEGRKLLYMPTATTKLLTRKYSSDLSPTTVSAITKERIIRIEPSGGEDSDMVVSRGTSPTPNVSTAYVRSKRAEFCLEKKVPSTRKTAETAHKEVQTDSECSLPRYAAFGDGGNRPFRPSYGGQTGSNFPGRTNYMSESRLGLSDCGKFAAREDSDGASGLDISRKSPSMRPPSVIKTPPTSPLKDSDKKTSGEKSPPTGGKPSLTFDCAKFESEKKPNSPTHPPSPLHCKTTAAHSPTDRPGAPFPKVTIDRCPDIPQTIDDVSSASESSEEETSSDDDHDDPVPFAAVVKKSVTNFLQNIPNHLHQNPSRSSLCPRGASISPQKSTFQKTESGERPRWLEVSEKSQVVARVRSARSVGIAQEPQASNLLSPSYLLNRQFSRDKDWLKESYDDLSKQNGALPLKDDFSPRDSVLSGQGVTNGEPFGRAQRSGNCGSVAEFGGDIFDAAVPLRKRNQSKVSENFHAEDSNEQMKFNQQSGEYFTDFQRECNQKIQNGLGREVEEKNHFEASDMSGMISRAKAGLAKSKTKLDMKKSSSPELSPKVTDTKSEIDLYWRELADSLTRPLTLCDLDFTDLNSDDETDLFGNNAANGEVPPPPPMLFLPVPSTTPASPRTPNAPPAPAVSPPRAKAPAPPPAPQIVKSKKTVKLFWKEVKDEPFLPKLKAPDGASLIWDELVKVKVDTQKLEYLFESRAKDLLSKKQQEQNKSKEIIVLDPKRSNAINIGMTKLPPPRSIKTAILKMDATVVNKEGIDKLLTMLPTEEEKLRIQEAQANNPDVPLGSAEHFLITLASISEIEARLRLWAFKLNFDNNEKEICDPLMDLKQGMEILRANKTFRAILSTLLSVGNFLNGYDVKGFQIDYLSKVPEVKDTVHKHSLLHHLCLIVMDKFPDSTDLYSEIGAVTRASKVDFDELAVNIKKIEEECKLSWNYLKMIAKHEGHTAMKVKMSDFLADCAERIIVMGTVYKRIMSRFQKFLFWLGVPTNRLSTTRPNEIFKTVSEFALEYRTTRERVLLQIKKINREKTRTRGHLAIDPHDMGTTKINSKAAKDDVRLKQLLQDETTYLENTSNAPAWRRQRKDTKNLLQESNKNDEEILDALIKTANQMPSPRMKERRRSRIYGKYL